MGDITTRAKSTGSAPGGQGVEDEQAADTVNAVKYSKERPK
jgi:hypothetical protein